MASGSSRGRLILPRSKSISIICKWRKKTDTQKVDNHRGQPYTPTIRGNTNTNRSGGGMFAWRAPGACPARYLCIKYLISSPRFILTLGSPPSRLH